MNKTIALSAKAGDILFYRSNTKTIKEFLLGWLIKLITHSNYTHCAIAISPTEKIEAIQIGICKTPIKKYDAIWHISCDQKNLEHACSWLNTMLGQPYGYLDFIASIVYEFEDEFSFNWKAHYDCSSLAAEFLVQAGIDLKQYEEQVHIVTPARLALLLGVH